MFHKLYTKEINELLREIAEELPYCALTPANDSKLKDDGTHFSSKSYYALGKRHLKKYLELVK